MHLPLRSTLVLGSLALLFALFGGIGGGKPALADPLQSPGLVAVDANISGNSALTLGSVDSCVGGLSVGDTFQVDVVVDAVPGPPTNLPTVGRAINGFSYDLLYSASVVRIDASNADYLLSSSGGAPIRAGDTLPDSNGDYMSAWPDLSSNFDAGRGVLERITLRAMANGTTSLHLSNVIIADSSSTMYGVSTITDAEVRVGSFCPGAPSIDNVAIDMLTGTNTANSIGPTDTCLSVSSGTTLIVDVVLGPLGIPILAPSNAISFAFNSSPRLEVTDAHAEPFKFGGGGIDPPIAPDGDGQFDYAYVNLGSPGATGPGTAVRLTLHALSSVPSITPLTLTNVDVQTPTAISVPISDLGGAQLAINAPCGSPDTDGDTVVNSADNCRTVSNYDQANQDGDEYGDACEYASCVTVINHWTTPMGDNDCDGFPGTMTVAGRAAESVVGTNAAAKCAATMLANDESGTDAWPVDFNDDQKANVLDVSTFSSHFNSQMSPPIGSYGVRWDLNADGKVNIADVTVYSSFFMKSCSP